MRILSLIMMILIAVIGVTFAVLNAQAVTLNYYFGSSQASLSMVIVCAVGLGILIGLLSMTFPLLKLKASNFSLKREVNKSKKD